MSLPFTPKHAHPFVFHEILELEVPIIAAEVPRLQNSINRLKDSNDQIRSHVESLAEPDDADEVAEMQEVIKENEETINAQEERIMMLKYALEAKMGYDPTNSHYGVDENKAVISEETTQGIHAPQTAVWDGDHRSNPASTSNLERSQDEGMYL